MNLAQRDCSLESGARDERSPPGRRSGDHAPMSHLVKIAHLQTVVVMEEEPSSTGVVADQAAYLRALITAVALTLPLVAQRAASPRSGMPPWCGCRAGRPPGSSGPRPRRTGRSGSPSAGRAELPEPCRAGLGAADAMPWLISVVSADLGRGLAGRGRSERSGPVPLDGLRPARLGVVSAQVPAMQTTSPSWASVTASRMR